MGRFIGKFFFASKLKAILQYSKFKKKIDPSALNDYLTYTDIVGIASEVIQNNCRIIVKPRDSQALVEAIIRLLKNPKLAKKMGENGRKLVESKYSWESISTQIDNIYQGVIS